METVNLICSIYIIVSTLILVCFDIFSMKKGKSKALMFLKYRLINLTPIALDKVFENIVDPIIVVNTDGIIVNMNPAAEKMVNQPLDRCFGIDIRECLRDQGISFSDILEQKEGRYEVLRKINGEVNHIDILLSKLEIKTGKTAGWVIMFRDITKYKKAQNMLVSSKDTLAKLVDEKSIQLQSTVTSLKKEVAMRQEIESRVVEEWKRAEFYLDLLNHDMSNINQDMLSRVQLMGLHQTEGSVFKSHLKDLEMSLKRSIKLIKNVKTLNKLANTPVEKGNVEIIGIIQKIIYQLKSNNRLNGVDIELKTDEKNYLVKGGRYADDIFGIVIENGVEVQDNGKGKMDIRITQHPTNTDFIRTEILDQGPGIPDHEKDDLLNREKRMGDKMLTGVSLLLARILAERYGGKMKIKDRIIGDYRQGACFIIDLKKA
jgi:PAS domain S-box-containing protein